MTSGITPSLHVHACETPDGLTVTVRVRLMACHERKIRMLANLRSDYPYQWQEFEVSNHDVKYPSSGTDCMLIFRINVIRYMCRKGGIPLLADNLPPWVINGMNQPDDAPGFFCEVGHSLCQS